MKNCNKKSVIEWIRDRNYDKDSPKDFKNINKIEDE